MSVTGAVDIKLATNIFTQLVYANPSNNEDEPQTLSREIFASRSFRHRIITSAMNILDLPKQQFAPEIFSALDLICILFLHPHFRSDCIKMSLSHNVLARLLSLFSDTMILFLNEAIEDAPDNTIPISQEPVLHHTSDEPPLQGNQQIDDQEGTGSLDMSQNMDNMNQGPVWNGRFFQFPSTDPPGMQNQRGAGGQDLPFDLFGQCTESVSLDSNEDRNDYQEPFSSVEDLSPLNRSILPSLDHTIFEGDMTPEFLPDNMGQLMAEFLSTSPFSAPILSEPPLSIGENSALPLDTFAVTKESIFFWNQLCMIYTALSCCSETINEENTILFQSPSSLLQRMGLSPSITSSRVMDTPAEMVVDFVSSHLIPKFHSSLTSFAPRLVPSGKMSFPLPFLSKTSLSVMTRYGTASQFIVTPLPIVRCSQPDCGSEAKLLSTTSLKKIIGIVQFITTSIQSLLNRQTRTSLIEQAFQTSAQPFTKEDGSEKTAKAINTLKNLDSSLLRIHIEAMAAIVQQTLPRVAKALHSSYSTIAETQSNIDQARFVLSFLSPHNFDVTDVLLSNIRTQPTHHKRKSLNAVKTSSPHNSFIFRGRQEYQPSESFHQHTPSHTPNATLILTQPGSIPNQARPIVVSRQSSFAPTPGERSPSSSINKGNPISSSIMILDEQNAPLAIVDDPKNNVHRYNVYMRNLITTWQHLFMKMIHIEDSRLLESVYSSFHLFLTTMTTPTLNSPVQLSEKESYHYLQRFDSIFSSIPSHSLILGILSRLDQHKGPDVSAHRGTVDQSNRTQSVSKKRYPSISTRHSPQPSNKMISLKKTNSVTVKQSLLSSPDTVGSKQSKPSSHYAGPHHTPFNGPAQSTLLPPVIFSFIQPWDSVPVIIAGHGYALTLAAFPLFVTPLVVVPPEHQPAESPETGHHRQNTLFTDIHTLNIETDMLSEELFPNQPQKDLDEEEDELIQHLSHPTFQSMYGLSNPTGWSHPISPSASPESHVKGNDNRHKHDVAVVRTRSNAASSKFAAPSYEDDIRSLLKQFSQLSADCGGNVPVSMSPELIEEEQSPDMLQQMIEAKLASLELLIALIQLELDSAARHAAKNSKRSQESAIEEGNEESEHIVRTLRHQCIHLILKDLYNAPITQHLINELDGIQSNLSLFSIGRLLLSFVELCVSDLEEFSKSDIKYTRAFSLFDSWNPHSAPIHMFKTIFSDEQAYLSALSTSFNTQAESSDLELNSVDPDNQDVPSAVAKSTRFVSSITLPSVFYALSLARVRFSFELPTMSPVLDSIMKKWMPFINTFPFALTTKPSLMMEYITTFSLSFPTADFLVSVPPPVSTMLLRVTSVMLSFSHYQILSSASAKAGMMSGKLSNLETITKAHLLVTRSLLPDCVPWNKLGTPLFPLQVEYLSVLLESLSNILWSDVLSSQGHSLHFGKLGLHDSQYYAACLLSTRSLSPPTQLHNDILHCLVHTILPFLYSVSFSFFAHNSVSSSFSSLYESVALTLVPLLRLFTPNSSPPYQPSSEVFDDLVSLFPFFCRYLGYLHRNPSKGSNSRRPSVSDAVSPQQVSHVSSRQNSARGPLRNPDPPSLAQSSTFLPLYTNGPFADGSFKVDTDFNRLNVEGGSFTTACNWRIAEDGQAMARIGLAMWFEFFIVQLDVAMNQPAPKATDPKHTIFQFLTKTLDTVANESIKETAIVLGFQNDLPTLFAGDDDAGNEDDSHPTVLEFLLRGALIAHADWTISPTSFSNLHLIHQVPYSFFPTVFPFMHVTPNDRTMADVPAAYGFFLTTKKKTTHAFSLSMSSGTFPIITVRFLSQFISTVIRIEQSDPSKLLFCQPREVLNEFFSIILLCLSMSDSHLTHSHLRSIYLQNSSGALSLATVLVYHRFSRHIWRERGLSSPTVKSRGAPPPLGDILNFLGMYLSGIGLDIGTYINVFSHDSVKNTSHSKALLRLAVTQNTSLLGSFTQIPFSSAAITPQLPQQTSYSSETERPLNKGRSSIILALNDFFTTTFRTLYASIPDSFSQPPLTCLQSIQNPHPPCAILHLTDSIITLLFINAESPFTDPIHRLTQGLDPDDPFDQTKHRQFHKAPRSISANDPVVASQKGMETIRQRRLFFWYPSAFRTFSYGVHCVLHFFHTFFSMNSQLINSTLSWIHFCAKTNQPFVFHTSVLHSETLPFIERLVERLSFVTYVPSNAFSQQTGRLNVVACQRALRQPTAFRGHPQPSSASGGHTEGLIGESSNFMRRRNQEASITQNDLMFMDDEDSINDQDDFSTNMQDLWMWAREYESNGNKTVEHTKDELDAIELSKACQFVDDILYLLLRYRLTNDVFEPYAGNNENPIDSPLQDPHLLFYSLVHKIYTALSTIPGHQFSQFSRLWHHLMAVSTLWVEWTVTFKSSVRYPADTSTIFLGILSVSMFFVHYLGILENVLREEDNKKKRKENPRPQGAEQTFHFQLNHDGQIDVFGEGQITDSDISEGLTSEIESLSGVLVEDPNRSSGVNVLPTVFSRAANQSGDDNTFTLFGTTDTKNIFPLRYDDQIFDVLSNESLTLIRKNITQVILNVVLLFSTITQGPKMNEKGFNSILSEGTTDSRRGSTRRHSIISKDSYPESARTTLSSNPSPSVESLFTTLGLIATISADDPLLFNIHGVDFQRELIAFMWALVELNGTERTLMLLNDGAKVYPQVICSTILERGTHTLITNQSQMNRRTGAQSSKSSFLNPSDQNRHLIPLALKSQAPATYSNFLLAVYTRIVNNTSHLIHSLVSGTWIPSSFTTVAKAVNNPPNIPRWEMTALFQVVPDLMNLTAIGKSQFERRESELFKENPASIQNFERGEDYRQDDHESTSNRRRNRVNLQEVTSPRTEISLNDIDKTARTSSETPKFSIQERLDIADELFPLTTLLNHVLARMALFYSTQLINVLKQFSFFEAFPPPLIPPPPQEHQSITRQSTRNVPVAFFSHGSNPQNELLTVPSSTFPHRTGTNVAYPSRQNTPVNYNENLRQISQALFAPHNMRHVTFLTTSMRLLSTSLHSIVELLAAVPHVSLVNREKHLISLNSFVTSAMQFISAISGTPPNLSPQKQHAPQPQNDQSRVKSTERNGMVNNPSRFKFLSKKSSRRDPSQDQTGAAFVGLLPVSNAQRPVGFPRLSSNLSIASTDQWTVDSSMLPDGSSRSYSTAYPNYNASFALLPPTDFSVWITNEMKDDPTQVWAPSPLFFALPTVDDETKQVLLDSIVALYHSLTQWCRNQLIAQSAQVTIPHPRQPQQKFRLTRKPTKRKAIQLFQLSADERFISSIPNFLPPTTLTYNNGNIKHILPVRKRRRRGRGNESKQSTVRRNPSGRLQGSSPSPKDAQSSGSSQHDRLSWWNCRIVFPPGPQTLADLNMRKPFKAGSNYSQMKPNIHVATHTTTLNKHPSHFKQNSPDKFTHDTSTEIDLGLEEIESEGTIDTLRSDNSFGDDEMVIDDFVIWDSFFMMGSWTANALRLLVGTGSSRLFPSFFSTGVVEDSVFLHCLSTRISSASPHSVMQAHVRYPAKLTPMFPLITVLRSFPLAASHQTPLYEPLASPPMANSRNMRSMSHLISSVNLVRLNPSPSSLGLPSAFATTPRGYGASRKNSFLSGDNRDEKPSTDSILQTPFIAYSRPLISLASWMSDYSVSTGQIVTSIETAFTTAISELTSVLGYLYDSFQENGVENDQEESDSVQSEETKPTSREELEQVTLAESMSDSTQRKSHDTTLNKEKTTASACIHIGASFSEFKVMSDFLFQLEQRGEDTQQKEDYMNVHVVGENDEFEMSTEDIFDDRARQQQAPVQLTPINEQRTSQQQSTEQTRVNTPLTINGPTMSQNDFLSMFSPTPPMHLYGAGTPQYNPATPYFPTPTKNDTQALQTPVVPMIPQDMSLLFGSPQTIIGQRMGVPLTPTAPRNPQQSGGMPQSILHTTLATPQNPLYMPSMSDLPPEMQATFMSANTPMSRTPAGPWGGMSSVFTPPTHQPHPLMTTTMSPEESPQGEMDNSEQDVAVTLEQETPPQTPAQTVPSTPYIPDSIDKPASLPFIPTQTVPAAANASQLLVSLIGDDPLWASVALTRCLNLANRASHLIPFYPGIKQSPTVNQELLRDHSSKKLNSPKQITKADSQTIGEIKISSRDDEEISFPDALEPDEVDNLFLIESTVLPPYIELITTQVLLYTSISINRIAQGKQVRGTSSFGRFGHPFTEIPFKVPFPADLPGDPDGTPVLSRADTLADGFEENFGHLMGSSSGTIGSMTGTMYVEHLQKQEARSKAQAQAGPKTILIKNNKPQQSPDLRESGQSPMMSRQRSDQYAKGGDGRNNSVRQMSSFNQAFSSLNSFGSLSGIPGDLTELSQTLVQQLSPYPSPSTLCFTRLAAKGIDPREELVEVEEMVEEYSGDDEHMAQAAATVEIEDYFTSTDSRLSLFDYLGLSDLAVFDQIKMTYSSAFQKNEEMFMHELLHTLYGIDANNHHVMLRQKAEWVKYRNYHFDVPSSFSTSPLLKELSVYFPLLAQSLFSNVLFSMKSYILPSVAELIGYIDHLSVSQGDISEEKTPMSLLSLLPPSSSTVQYASSDVIPHPIYSLGLSSPFTVPSSSHSFSISPSKQYGELSPILSKTNPFYCAIAMPFTKQWTSLMLHHEEQPIIPLLTSILTAAPSLQGSPYTQPISARSLHYLITPDNHKQRFPHEQDGYILTDKEFRWMVGLTHVMISLFINSSLVSNDQNGPQHSNHSSRPSTVMQHSTRSSLVDPKKMDYTNAEIITQMPLSLQTRGVNTSSLNAPSPSTPWSTGQHRALEQNDTHIVEKYNSSSAVLQSHRFKKVMSLYVALSNTFETHQHDFSVVLLAHPQMASLPSHWHKSLVSFLNTPSDDEATIASILSKQSAPENEIPLPVIIPQLFRQTPALFGARFKTILVQSRINTKDTANYSPFEISEKKAEPENTIVTSRKSFFKDSLVWFGKARHRTQWFVPWNFKIKDDSGKEVPVSMNDFMGEFWLSLGERQKPMFDVSPSGFIYPNRNASVKEMEIIGRVLGKCLVDGAGFGPYLAPFVWKFLIGKPLSILDSRMINENFCNNTLVPLVWNDTNLLQPVPFVYTSPSGERIDLMEGGDKIFVTDLNKATYIDLLLQKLLVTPIEPQLKALSRGLSSVLVTNHLELYTLHEAYHLLSSPSDRSVQLLDIPNGPRANTVWLQIPLELRKEIDRLPLHAKGMLYRLFTGFLTSPGTIAQFSRRSTVFEKPAPPKQVNEDDETHLEVHVHMTRSSLVHVNPLLSSVSFPQGNAAQTDNIQFVSNQLRLFLSRLFFNKL
ncbi:putative HECT-domain (ubiquitin-transferase) [Blattamonas nauphoetae]|uniref:HECT-type E3 ubiquitin transferase n=1 Tax=Blattamonas nauphoetae TaxID=2049346 RepID=A0ABQ9YES0_9EUKA|nr:putative HECT-domain (ubiquitin-transferase) [Blattamonas nauphoetae]